jgi:hypothetical protein
MKNWNYRKDRHLTVLKNCYSIFGFSFFNLKDVETYKNQIYKDVSFSKIKYSIERNWHHHYLEKYLPRVYSGRGAMSSFELKNVQLRKLLIEQGKNVSEPHYRVAIQGIIALQRENLLPHEEQAVEVAKFYLTEKENILEM